jgi:hypothetical protein
MNPFSFSLHSSIAAWSSAFGRSRRSCSIARIFVKSRSMVRRHSVLVNGALSVLYMLMLWLEHSSGWGCVFLTLSFVSLGERLSLLICMAGRPNEFRRIDSQHLSRSGFITPRTCLPQDVLQRRVTRYSRVLSVTLYALGDIIRERTYLRHSSRSPYSSPHSRVALPGPAFSALRSLSWVPFDWAVPARVRHLSQV